MADFYPDSLAARVAWHANFAAQAGSSGIAHGLSLLQVTQAGDDATEVANMVNATDTVHTFSQSWTQFATIMLEGDIHAPLPAIPIPPALYVLTSSAPGIEARTRLFAGIIRAHPTYTPEVGESFGIIGPAPGAAGTPSLKATAETNSHVRLKIAKQGYFLIAIDSRRGGGAWESIGPSQTATFIDSRPPLVAGQPEQRDYRCQGVVNNARVGGMSPVVSAVTVP